MAVAPSLNGSSLVLRTACARYPLHHECRGGRQRHQDCTLLHRQAEHHCLRCEEGLAALLLLALLMQPLPPPPPLLLLLLLLCLA